MLSLGGDDLPIRDTTVVAQDRITCEFKLIHPVVRVRCIDHDLSIPKHLPGPPQMTGFRRLRHVTGCMGPHHVARNAESRGHVILSDAAAGRLKALRCPGLRLVPAERRYDHHRSNRDD
ncbi:hypothetical protein [Ancylobacter terrae]|uniref:hypothetical protein n=1 Tax=Ancylobacter sp. sgz301288 TaxID=3342077 RepID=UPI00385D2DD8